MEDNKQPQSEEVNALETLEGPSGNTSGNPDTIPSEKIPKKKTSLTEKLRSLVTRINIYLLLFIMLIIVGLIIFFVVFNASQDSNSAVTESQELTQEAIDELIGSDAKVGDPKQLLTIESDSVFAGKVLIRDGLDVAGPIKVGGSLSLPGITVSGASAFDEVSINTLAIAGDATVQGQLSVERGLTVSGPVTFSGTFSAASFSIQSLQVNQNLQLNRHIDAGGPTPRVSAGGGIGSGGTVTISGTDTAGTVTVNIGSGGGNGVLAIINFAAAFDGTPHVVISPVNSAAPNAFISNRTTTGFSISSSGQSTVSFDYIVID
jgi:cytoskeletal protein CcmA (bactofilin family)